MQYYYYIIWPEGKTFFFFDNLFALIEVVSKNIFPSVVMNLQY